MVAREWQVAIANSRGQEGRSLALHSSLVKLMRGGREGEREGGREGVAERMREGEGERECKVAAIKGASAAKWQTTTLTILRRRAAPPAGPDCPL